MKKSLLLLLVCLSSLSCDSNDVVSPVDEISTEFVNYRKLATYHSEGLEYARKAIFNGVKTRSTSKLAGLTVSGMELFIKKTTSDFMESIEIPNLIQIPNIAISRGNNDMVSTSVLHSDIDCYLTKIADDLALNGTISDNVNALVANLGSDSYYNSLSITDQKAVLMYIAVFEDSYNYWSASSAQWRFSDEPITRGFWSAVVECAKADAVGAFIGGVGAAAEGAWAGGVAGAAVGGVGAIPGAIAGAGSAFVGGAISGAVTGSLTLVLCDDMGLVSNDLIKSNGVVDSTSTFSLNKK